MNRPVSFARILATLALAIALPATAGTGCVVKTAPPPAPPPAAEPTPPPPPADTDGDGIVDTEDKCPDKKGVKNEDPEKNGCPAPKALFGAAAKKVSIDSITHRLNLTDKIMFKSGLSDIDPVSNGLLDEIASEIKLAAKIDLVEVAGHADKQGDVKSNLKLTDARAASVVKALVDRGVDAKKIRAKGYSSYCPVDPNDDEKNRRVEFIIVKMDGKATGAPLGCDAATKAGVKPDPVK